MTVKPSATTQPLTAEQWLDYSIEGIDGLIRLFMGDGWKEDCSLIHGLTIARGQINEARLLLRSAVAGGEQPVSLVYGASREQIVGNAEREGAFMVAALRQAVDREAVRRAWKAVADKHAFAYNPVYLNEGYVDALIEFVNLSLSPQTKPERFIEYYCGPCNWSGSWKQPESGHPKCPACGAYMTEAPTSPSSNPQPLREAAEKVIRRYTYFVNNPKAPIAGSASLDAAMAELQASLSASAKPNGE